MSHFLRLYNNIMNFLNDKFAHFCGFLLFALMILLTINVISREIGFPVKGIMSIGILIMISVIYLGMSNSEQRDEHASVDILPTLLPSKWINFNNIIVNILNFITIGIFLFISMKEFINSYQSNEVFLDLIKIPIWPAKLFMSIGLFLFALQIIYKLIESIVVVFKLRESDEENKKM